MNQYYLKYINISYINMTMSNEHIIVKDTGGRLNKKDGLTRYGNSHVKDKTS